jgi:AcrR family transcriptional regulator
MTVKRRPGGRSARVRAAVLTATLGELGAVGYAQLSLEGIARRAGVNRTTVYRRWGTREALLLDAMLTRADEVVPVPDTGSLREDLVQLARAAVANASSPEVEPLVRTVIAELPHNPALRDASLRFWGERMSLDGAIVERAIARGDVPADTHSRSVIEAVLGPLHMRLLVSGTPPDEAAIERVVDLVVAAVTR